MLVCSLVLVGASLVVVDSSEMVVEVVSIVGGLLVYADSEGRVVLDVDEVSPSDVLERPNVVGAEVALEMLVVRLERVASEVVVPPSEVLVVTSIDLVVRDVPLEGPVEEGTTNDELVVLEICVGDVVVVEALSRVEEVPDELDETLIKELVRDSLVAKDTDWLENTDDVELVLVCEPGNRVVEVKLSVDTEVSEATEEL